MVVIDFGCHIQLQSHCSWLGVVIVDCDEEPSVFALGSYIFVFVCNIEFIPRLVGIIVTILVDKIKA
jgi:hypothetical protein